MENNSEAFSAASPQDTFRILIASDIHLGFNDNNVLREDDSYNTFEEILQIAQDEKVDFVLLGGDLFHENKPKPTCLHRTIDLLRKFVLGPKPVEFEYLGDPAQDFPRQEDPEMNYNNPNINIGMPIFTIHGNHDDPIGTKKVCALDHLTSARLINHIGQWDRLDGIDIKPVLLKKGETLLSLFGLGHIRDERLYRLMRDGKVRFVRPREQAEDWFNLFVLHQNRVKYGKNNYIPEEFLPEFLNMVIWGHEHECRISTEGEKIANDIYVVQPGSSVITSLCPGEEVEKKVAILSIYKKYFKLEPIKLKTVRPFLTRDYVSAEVLEDLNCRHRAEPSRHLEKYFEETVKRLIDETLEKLTGHPKQPKEPLIRIRIFYEFDSHIFNAMRFSTLFSGQIVNDEVVIFKKMQAKREVKESMDIGEIKEMIKDEAEEDIEGHIEEIIEKYFIKGREGQLPNQILQIFSERGLTQAVKVAAEKSDKDALDTIIEHQLERTCQHLIDRKVTDQNIDEEIKAYSETRYAMGELEVSEAQAVLENRIPKARGGNKRTMSNEQAITIIDDDSDDERNGLNGNAVDDDYEDESPTRRGAARGRGRGRGQPAARARAPPKGRGRGRPAAANPLPTSTRTNPSRSRRSGVIYDDSD